MSVVNSRNRIVVSPLSPAECEISLAGWFDPSGALPDSCQYPNSRYTLPRGSLAIMYHDVVEDGDFESSGFPGEGANVYKLRREDFERHLEAIRASIPAGVVSTITQYPPPPGLPSAPPPVFLTFDDGGASFHTPIAAMLEPLGWRGHFFITTDRLGQPGFLSPAQVRELHRRGHVIGSHSCSHPTRMAALTRRDMDREWRESLATLSSTIGAAVKVASVPGGYYSRQVGESAAAAGIEVLFTSEPTVTVATLGGCLVLGRYVIKRGMGPEWSVGFAAGRRSLRWRQTALWKAKGVAKSLGGDAYLKLRQAIIEN
jgi:peptidoglycan/xylan/chitin deacetylase (PgdA/CDA1 family)